MYLCSRAKRPLLLRSCCFDSGNWFMFALLTSRNHCLPWMWEVKVMKNKHCKTTNLQENEARGHLGWRNLWSDGGWKGVMTTTTFTSDPTFGHVLSHAIYTVWIGFVSGVTSCTDCNFDVRVAPEFSCAECVCAYSPISWRRFNTGSRL